MKRNPEKALSRLIIATGVSTVVAQLLIIREYLTQFQGNEYVIALIFFAWLLLGGCGSFLAGQVINRVVQADTGKLIGLSFLAATLPLVTLLTIRFARDLIFLPGASTGFYATVGFIFATLGPYGILVGFLLPYSLAALRSYNPRYPAVNAYILDNIGDCTGGALFAFVLIVAVSPIQAIALTSGLLILAAGTLVRFSDRSSLVMLTVAGAAATVLAIGLYSEIPSLQPSSGHLAWYQESKYGRITVVRDRGQATVYNDGVPLTSSREVAGAEAAIHYPMSQTEGPATVLLISAGSGMLAELEKYEPTSVDYVELNPAIAAAQFHFNLLKKIDGLKIVNQDGRAYLDAIEKKYDAIVVNISDPETFQANRYYTAAFYRLAKAHLSAAGILSFSVTGYANYISEPKLRFISSLKRTVGEYFKNVLILPGDRLSFICSDKDLDPDIPGRLAAKGIRTDYVSGYFYGSVTDERIRELSRQLIQSIPTNTDTHPYLMRLMLSRWFEKFTTSPRWLYLSLAGLLVLYFIRISREEYLLFSTGFMTMGCEIAVVFAFQMFFGYIYFQISLIVTVFLAGLLPGALIGQKFHRDPVRTLQLTDGLLIGMVGLLALIILPAGARPSPGGFLAFGFGVSVLCGCQFPLALKSGGQNPCPAAYAFMADLTGAACGALLTSVLLIPYLGLAGTLTVLAALKVSSLLVTGWGRRSCV